MGTSTMQFSTHCYRDKQKVDSNLNRLFEGKGVKKMVQSNQKKQSSRDAGLEKRLERARKRVLFIIGAHRSIYSVLENWTCEESTYVIQYNFGCCCGRYGVAGME